MFAKARVNVDSICLLDSWIGYEIPRKKLEVIKREYESLSKDEAICFRERKERMERKWKKKKKKHAKKRIERKRRMKVIEYIEKKNESERGRENVCVWEREREREKERERDGERERSNRLNKVEDMSENKWKKWLLGTLGVKDVF